MLTCSCAACQEELRETIQQLVAKLGSLQEQQAADAAAHGHERSRQLQEVQALREQTAAEAAAQAEERSCQLQEANALREELADTRSHQLGAEERAEAVQAQLAALQHGADELVASVHGWAARLQPGDGSTVVRQLEAVNIKGKSQDAAAAAAAAGPLERARGQLQRLGEWVLTLQQALGAKAKESQARSSHGCKRCRWLQLLSVQPVLMYMRGRRICSTAERA
jgi:chromosome segregation ATPase